MAYEIENILRSNNVWCDCYEENGFIKMEIDGDWKHEHLRAKFILEELGYYIFKEYDNENCSDWYFAKYRVLKMV